MHSVNLCLQQESSNNNSQIINGLDTIIKKQIIKSPYTSCLCIIIIKTSVNIINTNHFISMCFSSHRRNYYPLQYAVGKISMEFVTH